MTLLLAARTQSSILLTADGRCIAAKRGVRTTASDTLQKIFPVKCRPLAVAHHGQNILDGQPVSELLKALYCAHSGTISTANPRQLSLLIAQNLDSVVSRTLLHITDSKNCGFWICGVDNMSQTFQMYEVIWHKKSPGEINLRITPHGDLLMGGNAAQPIKKFLKQPVNARLSWKQVFKRDVQYSLDLHNELYRLAEESQPEGRLNSFGGHKHQLAITFDVCNWIIPPTRQKVSTQFSHLKKANRICG